MVIFNAKSHIDNLNIIFQYYGFEEVTPFSVVFKSYSAMVNIAISNIPVIPHSACDNHKLNLEVEDMHTNYRVLCELVEEVGRIGTYVRISCNKSAILFQFNNSRSVTTCKTSWTGSLMCIIFRLKISPGLDPIASGKNSDGMDKILMASYLCQIKTKV